MFPLLFGLRSRAAALGSSALCAMAFARVQARAKARLAARVAAEGKGPRRSRVAVASLSYRW